MSSTPRLPSTQAPPRPPAHLRRATRAFWRKVAARWALEDHHVELLRLACEAMDRADEAREAVTADGAYQLSKRDGTYRAHPGIAVEREAARTAMRAIRELGFDVTDEMPAQRRGVA